MCTNQASSHPRSFWASIKARRGPNSLYGSGPNHRLFTIEVAILLFCDLGENKERGWGTPVHCSTQRTYSRLWTILRSLNPAERGGMDQLSGTMSNG